MPSARSIPRLAPYAAAAVFAAAGCRAQSPPAAPPPNRAAQQELSKSLDKLLAATEELNALAEPLVSAKAETAPKNPMIETTDATYDSVVARHKGFVLVDFYADWCQPCHALGMEEIAEQLAGKATVLHMKVEDSAETAKKLDVITPKGELPLPLWVLLKDGGKVATIPPSNRTTMLKQLDAAMNGMPIITAARPSAP